MSVPLDRLYHYLSDLLDTDVVIYRWLPHGSKKLSDLRLLDPDQDHRPVLLPNVIAHDQEPLYYHYWSSSDIVEEILNRHRESVRTSRREVYQAFGPRHLRGLCERMNIYDRCILLHSERQSRELELYQNNNYLTVYYWNHALLSRDWFRYAEHDRRLNYNPGEIKHDFLIYNRAWSGSREYRLKLAEMLIDHRLVPYCHTAFNPVDHCQYTDHVFANPALAIKRYDLEKHFPLNCYPATMSADYDNRDYAQCGIEIVLETLFDDQRWHLTEKTLRPIACGKPFILASTPGALCYLQEYGFETFQGLINEEYDSITDPVERLLAIIDEMHRISHMPSQQKRMLWDQLHAVAQRNQQRFFSHKFTDFVVKEYINNMNDACENIQRFRKGETAESTWRVINSIPNVEQRSIQRYSKMLALVRSNL